ncbi:hypothetical protein [Coprobacillus sp. AF33-1AC]|uniref:hypothetical protein n=1 Tax=Coprobacillus sp. AF33-1AC TaxID=2292032 RepID=UPI000E4D9398|nr:hypothetical protein [Coprobacillus sp. AF33-1AC]RHM59663.1 hypothetical protein DWZ53_08955 [Coprobacillus sp. AF33-1AC]
MNNDIAPELLEKIEKQFDENIAKNEKIKKILEKIENKKATYQDVQEYAGELGKCLSNSFKLIVSEDTLPDGKFYYNIAQRLIEPTVKKNYESISKQCEIVQTNLNKNANIGIKAVVPKYNSERTDSIINYVSTRDKYSDCEKSFLDVLEHNARLIVDDSVKENAQFHDSVGLNPKIVRIASSGCCKWCSSLAGTYNYRDVSNTGNDVFRRHANCHCSVIYDPINGSRKVQNVWDKKIENKDELKKRIERINQSLINDNKKNYKLNLQMFAKYKSLRLDAHTRSELNTWLKHDEIESGTLMLKDIGDYRYYFVYNDFDNYTLYKKVKIRGRNRSK